MYFIYDKYKTVKATEHEKSLQNYKGSCLYQLPKHVKVKNQTWKCKIFIKTWKAKSGLKFSGPLGLAWECWRKPLTCNIVLVSFYFMLSVGLNLSYHSAPNICNPLTTHSERWELIPSGEESSGHSLSWVLEMSLGAKEETSHES